MTKTIGKSIRKKSKLIQFFITFTAVLAALAVSALGLTGISPAYADQQAITPPESATVESSTSSPSPTTSPSSAVPSSTPSQELPSEAPDDELTGRPLAHQQGLSSSNLNASSGFTTESAFSSGKNASSLAADLEGKNVTVSNASWSTSSNKGLGTFTGANDILGIDSGVVLSSGDANQLPGTKSVASAQLGVPGDSQVGQITGGSTYDASILEFDVTPTEENLEFNYVFTSGELNYVGSFNDGVGLWVDGQNCAKLPTGDAATLNNLRQKEANQVYSILNKTLTQPIRQNVWAVPLSCKVTVTPNETVRVKIAVADALDRILDSAIFVNENSVRSLPSTNIELQGTPTVNDQEETQFSALVTDNDGNPLAGKEVRFAYQGAFYTAITDANGIAISPMLPPAKNPGNGKKVGLEISFLGDDDYASSNQFAQLTFEQAPPVQVPAKPSATIVDSTSVDVTVPANDEGPTPAKYKLYVAGNESKFCEVSAPADPLTCTISGLSPGGTYLFAAKAILGGDVAGPSVLSDPLTLTAPAKPNTPTVQVNGEGDITVTVNPADPGGGTPEEYKVVVYDDEGNVVDEQTIPATTDPLIADFSGLDPDTPYTVDVQASNPISDSEASDKSKKFLADIPGVPGAPKPKVVADGEIEVTVDPPVDGGNLEYTIYAYEDGSDEPIDECVISANADQLMCVFTPLDSEKTYVFDSTSSNGDTSSGKSPQSGGFVADEPGQMPKPDVSVQFPAGNVTVDIETPADGGTPDEYKIYVLEDGEDEPVQECSITSPFTPMSCDFTGLDPQQQYSFVAEAINGAGTSTSESAGPVHPAAPAKPQGAASILNFTSGAGTVQVTVLPQEGGGPADTFTVSRSDGGPDCVLQATDEPLVCTFNNVADSANVVFTIEAQGGGGKTESDPIGPVIFEGPDAPTAVDASVSSVGEVAVTITPAVTGGTPTEFVVVALVDGQEQPQACSAVVYANPLACTVTGLNPLVEYTFEVKAINGIDESDSLETSPVVKPNLPAGPPGAPSAVIVTDDQDDPVISVTVPPSTTGGTPDQYNVYMFTNGVLDPEPVCVVPAPQDPDTPITCNVAGLSEGSTYSFIADAENFAKSTPSDVSPDIDFSKPNAPQTPEPKAIDNGKVEVTVTPPADGGTPAEYLIYAYDPNSATPDEPVAFCAVPANADPLSCVIGAPDTNPLDPEVAYVFDAESINGLGESDSNSDKTDPPIYPSVPKKPSIKKAEATDNGTVEIEVEPSSDPGAPAESFTVVAYDEEGNVAGECSFDATDPNLKCQIDNLDPAGEYTFEVVAENSAGQSQPSDASDPVIPSVPTKPGVPDVAVLNDGEVQVNVIPGTGGALADSYKVLIYEQDSNTPLGIPCDPDPVPADAESLSCTFEGLDESTSYEFEVIATNTAGDSEASQKSSPVIPAKPGTPEAPNAEVKGKGIVEVAVLPAEEGGKADEYTVEIYEEGSDEPVSGATCVPTPIPATEDPLACTFSGLDEDTTYVFKAKAKNGAGESDQSEDSNAVTPDESPGAPGVPEVVITDEGEVEATITSSESGGKPKKYVVKAKEKGSDQVASSCEILLPADPLSCQVQGLDPEKEYEFEAEAENDGGVSPASEMSESLVPALPAAPDFQVEVLAPGKIVITPSKSTEGGTPAKYTIKLFPGDDLECVVDVTQGETSCTFEDLSLIQEYEFEVVAENAVGPSEANTGSVFPDFAPDKAQKPVVDVVDPGKVKVIPKKNTSGPFATNYVVTMEPTGEVCDLTYEQVPFECVFEGLDTEEPYEFNTEASNRSGNKGKSSPAEGIVAAEPSAPQGLTADVTTPGSATLTVQPAQDGGTPSEYEVFVKDDPSKKCTVLANASPLVCTISGLDPFVAYQFESNAKNGAGTSENSDSTSEIFPNLVPAKPAPPVPSYIKPGQAKVTVPPAKSGGKPQSYKVFVNGDPSKFCTVTMPASPISCVIKGLSQKKSYKFVAQAINELGTSTTSGVSKSFIPKTPAKPKTPKAPKVKPVSGSSVTVTIPENQTVKGATRYVAKVSPSGKRCTISAIKTPLSCAIEGLKPGVKYNVTITATNAGGKSKKSKPTSFEVPRKPRRVIGLRPQSTSSGSKVKLSWLRPSTWGDRPVTGYRVTLQQRGKKPLLLDQKLGRKVTTISFTRNQLIRLMNEQGKLRGEVELRRAFIVKVFALNAAGRSGRSEQQFTMRFELVNERQ